MDILKYIDDANVGEMFIDGMRKLITEYIDNQILFIRKLGKIISLEEYRNLSRERGSTRNGIISLIEGFKTLLAGLKICHEVTWNALKKTYYFSVPESDSHIEEISVKIESGMRKYMYLISEELVKIKRNSADIRFNLLVFQSNICGFRKVQKPEICNDVNICVDVFGNIETYLDFIGNFVELISERTESLDNGHLQA